MSDWAKSTNSSRAFGLRFSVSDDADSSPAAPRTSAPIRLQSSARFASNSQVGAKAKCRAKSAQIVVVDLVTQAGFFEVKLDKAATVWPNGAKHAATRDAETVATTGFDKWNSPCRPTTNSWQ